MSKYVINDSTLVAIGDAVREKDGTTAPIVVSDLATRIKAIPSGGEELPEEAFTVTGNCEYRFANGGWDWFVDTFSNRIKTENITACKYMFSSSNLKEIPFNINIKPAKSTDMLQLNYLFNGASIETVPYVYISGAANPTTAARSAATEYMFAGCKYLRDIPFDFFNSMIVDNEEFWNAAKNYGPNRNNMFANCYSLRELPDLKNLNHRQEASYYSSYVLYNNMLNGCSSLNEVNNLPVIDISVATGNCFVNTFRRAYRIKNITFETNEDGSPIVATWKKQVIDLSDGGYNSIGFCGSTSAYEDSIIGYNSGITKANKVTDEATYEALKNSDDWYSTSANYSRYNHDSAVATINSLPDVSSGSENTIKFLGNAGALTDGGAINTLTEEEIAVATAKGWTVTFA